MKGRLLSAIAVVLTLLAAGCIAAPKISSDDKSEVAAMANRDVAENAALAWSPDAKLVGAGAGELPTAREPLPADPSPGNGKAVAWTFLYAAGNASRAFMVAADGTLMSGNASDAKETRATKDMGPLGEWKIDSSKAMDAALTNETFSHCAKLPNATFAEIVGREGGADAPAVWYIVVFSTEGAAVAQVDAVSGELLTVQEIGMGFPMPDMGAYNVRAAPQQPVKVADRGALDEGKPTKTLNFTLPADGMGGMLRLRVSKPFLMDGLSWILQDASGEKVASGELSSPQPDERRAWKIDPLDAGAYTLTLAYVDGASAPVPMPGRGVDYDLTLVLGGAPTPPEED